jgi:threonine/homoserine/homoserine lactone efflux protein
MADPTPLTYFFQGAALGFSAALTPGPFQTFLISETLSGGWRRGTPIAFAPLISDLPIILLSLFLLNQVPANFLRLISFAGGAFVLYLAWRLWQNWRSGIREIDAELGDSKGNLWRGVAANMLGPGPYIFWALVSGPILLNALRQSIFAGLSFVLGFYGVMVITLLAIVVLFDQTRRLGTRVIHFLLLISIIILVIFAAVLFWQAVTWGV